MNHQFIHSFYTPPLQDTLFSVCLLSFRRNEETNQRIWNYPSSRSFYELAWGVKKTDMEKSKNIQVNDNEKETRWTHEGDLITENTISESVLMETVKNNRPDNLLNVVVSQQKKSATKIIFLFLLTRKYPASLPHQRKSVAPISINIDCKSYLKAKGKCKEAKS